MLKQLTSAAIGATIIFFTSPSYAQSKNGIKVLATIAPIYFLTKGVSGELNSIELLVSGKISPHDYQPKPSDIQKIKNSDLVIRIDQHFQPRFTKILNANIAGEKMFSLTYIPNLKLLPNEDHLATEHEDGHDDEHDENETAQEHAAHEAEEKEEAHSHSHSRSNFDLHIWLAPQNAVKITNAIAKKLSKLDPKNATTYAQNAEKQNIRLQALKLKVQQKLQTFNKASFLSHHDAFGYFTQAFGLKRSYPLIQSLNHQLSAYKLQEIIKLAKTEAINCIMLEPQLNDKVAKTIQKTKSDIKIETWDPLGFTLALTAVSYDALITKMADQLSKCLQK